jgi:hypothetical protein
MTNAPEGVQVRVGNKTLLQTFILVAIRNLEQFRPEPSGTPLCTQTLINIARLLSSGSCSLHSYQVYSEEGADNVIESTYLLPRLCSDRLWCSCFLTG